MLELYLKRKPIEAGGAFFVGKQSLVALDTDHIKQYVFATDKLKEIRGASSILDRLNRPGMQDIAKDVDQNAQLIFANGGAGLFEVDTDKADEFGKQVQQTFRERTAGSATITYVVQELPDGKAKIKDELAMMRYQLRAVKNCPEDIIILPSHPFMRPCSSCGIEYAEGDGGVGLHDPGEQDAIFCTSCQKKRWEDIGVKKSIDYYVGTQSVKEQGHIESPLWLGIIHTLGNIGYHIPKGTQRPGDFNDFRNFGKAKDYIGLIYADGNGMGRKIEELNTLPEIRDFAEAVDTSIYRAVCDAIKEHLPVWEGVNQESSEKEHLFPFDLLLLGGDDVVMVTSAAVAVKVSGHKSEVAFYATLRPYTVEELDFLLNMIREGKKMGLGRTKLHQVREAVLQMNLTTSVYEGMALLRNWRSRQRDFVTQFVREMGWHYQKPHSDEEKPGTMFPRAIFPWFADGPDAYKTPLLDFVELYDFVAQEEEEDAGAN